MLTLMRSPETSSGSIAGLRSGSCATDWPHPPPLSSSDTRARAPAAGRLRPSQIRIDARVSIEQWRRHYNGAAHSSLGYLTPAEYKGKHLADPMDGGRSPAMPARADQEEQCALNS